jgi:hypothetical protein
MNGVRYVAGLIFFLSLCGCSVLFPAKRDSPVLDDATLDDLRTRVTDFYRDNDNMKHYPGYERHTRALRDRIINDLLILSDSNEKKWRTQVKEVVNDRQIALDTLSIVFSTAGAVSSARLSHIFSASSSGTQGINATWDRRYLAEKSIDSAINAVGIERAKQKTLIIHNMKTLGIDEYGISDGVRDAVAYDELLTLEVGVSAIENSTSKALSEASKGLNDAQQPIKESGKLSDAPKPGDSPEPR